MACVLCDHSVLVSPCAVRPRCSGSSITPSAVPSSVRVRPASFRSQRRVLLLVRLVLLVAFSATASAAPALIIGRGLDVGAIGGILQRSQNSSSQNNSDGSQSNASVTMAVWLPILLVTLVFILFSLCTCLRRCAVGRAPSSTSPTSASTPANANTANRSRPRRRHRTPSQISTKSLPPYMKEPGDQELVLFRGPLEAEDDQALSRVMSTLAEEDDDDEGHRNGTFDVALDRVESFDTMADLSTTNLMRRVSQSVQRPPELHHATMPHGHQRSADAHSLDSIGSEAELLAAHQRGISVDGHASLRGEAPSYAEAVSAMTTISLNDPRPSIGSSSGVVDPLAAVDDLGDGRGRMRFSFLAHNPFGSHNGMSGAPSGITPSPPSIRSASPALHNRSGSALSRFPSCESYESQHSRMPSRSNNLSRTHTRSGSNLFRAFRSNSPVLHAGSSTISLDSISAPLTHTLTRAEFHAPKGGLTAEQIKLITSREALERFRIPYGPDAVAAFSLSRERLAETGPPPDFESATSAVDSSTTLSPAPDGGEAGTALSYTADGDEPRTARPATPETARPSTLSGVAGRRR